MIEVTGPLAGAATTVMVVKMKEPENMCPPALRYGHFGGGTRMAVVYGLGLGGPKIDVKTTTGLFSRPDGVLAFHLVTDRLHFVRMKPEAFPDVFA